MHKIALLENTVSKYGVLGSMTRALGEALKRQGIQTVFFEVHPENTKQFFEDVLKSAPDCTWGLNMFVDADSFYTPAGIPHINLFVDSCTYGHPLSFTSSHLISLFADKASTELFVELGGKRSYWCPHAISQQTIDHVRSLPDIPLADRPYDISFIGSWIDPMEARRIWEKGFSATTVNILTDMAERCLSDPSSMLLPEALHFFKKALDIKAVIEEGGLSPFALANSIQIYLRGVARERLLNAFHGRDVRIFTSDEDAARWSQEAAAKGLTFCPEVPFEKVIDLCLQSKVVLNTAPHIRKGYHERIFLSLASGAVTVVEKGRLPEWLVETERVAEYDGRSFADLQQRVDEAARRPFHREKVLSWLEAEHTWDARLRQLLPELDRQVTDLRLAWSRDQLRSGM